MYEKRIAEVFGKDDVPEVSEDNLLKYRKNKGDGLYIKRISGNTTRP